MRTLALCLLLMTIVSVGCGNEIVVYDRLRLEVSSEAPSSGTLTRYDISIVAFDGAGARVEKYPSPTSSELAKYAGPLPAGIDLVNKPLLVDVDLSAYGVNTPTDLQMRVRGLNDDLKPMTAWTGPVSAAMKGKFKVVLKRIDAQCDLDGDGTPDCSKPGCCPQGELGDCDDSPDKGANASPFGVENPCTQCGNGVDEDCNGEDTACVDSDSDGVPDCQETACGTGAENDDKVFPGAPELCDGKDNDCDGETDEQLVYTNIAGQPGNLAKGDSCGTGACAGGQVVCDAEGKGLVCSTADKKADKETCDNQADDDCNGKINDGCALQDIDGDGVPNDKEDLACAFKFARFHSEYHPGNAVKEQCCLEYTKLILETDSGWTDKQEIPADAKVTKEILSACDTNCDKQVSPCGVKDKDGDGVSAPLDCDDNDPLVHTGAAEKCGDGVVQGCVGTDPKCDPDKDKDGDGWYAPADCDDNDPTVAPDAKEVCNGKDNDCDGHIDSGNPEAFDEVCGDKDGECGKKPGVKVCKHWPTGQDPGALDCLDKPYDSESLTCVGCVGDQRPEKDICDYLDNDCDGKSDEDYTYTEEKSGDKLLIGASCDGVGVCGAGKVECRATKDKAVCSTDPEGSKKQNKPEICDNKDNNCDGQTDESLTTIADSTCSKAGVCAGSAVQSISTVCKAGKWVCDYSKVPFIEFNKSKACKPGDPFCHCPGLSGQGCFRLIESSCDGKDNDCDGKLDDDFVFDDLGKTKPVGAGCGTGVCGGGKVICKSNKSGLTCSTLTKVSKEVCDAKDNDCNGKTDDGMTIVDSPCKVKGQCTTSNVVSSCTGGKWVCDYAKVPAYEGSKEKSCDGKDNDCDGKADEDFSYNNLGKTVTIGQGCGAGVCGGGKVVCNGAKNNVTCSTLTKKGSEICDVKDNDCDGKTDEGFTYKGLGVGVKCDGVGACGSGVVECTPGKTNEATCSTNPNGSSKQNKTEICDNLDNDCDGKADEGCNDDGDKYCDKNMVTSGKPKICSAGGGDCNDLNANINPGRVELCNGKDDNCAGGIDEIFSYTETNKATNSVKKLKIGDSCGLGVCAGGKVQCAGTQAATCSTLSKKGVEICDGKDNNCDGRVDEGCDDDKDDYCDKNMTVVGKPSVCPKGGGDCNDAVSTTHPNATELCDNVNNDCDSSTDEGCDDDNDGYCDINRVTIGFPKVCPKGGGDCNDSKFLGAKIYPDAPEVCNGKDDDCDAKTDAADAGDLAKTAPSCENSQGVCKGAVKPVSLCVSGAWKTCPDSTYKALIKAYESTKELTCDNLDNDCDGQKDEGCDDDNDDYCDKNMLWGGQSSTCSKGNNDCDDGKKAVNPGAKEDCLTKYDDNCDGDSNDKNASNCVTYYQDGDGDGFGVGAGVCMCAPVPALDFTAKKTGDCDDKKKGSNTYSYDGKDLGQSCGVGICSGGTVVCSGKKATCSTLSKALSKEICNGKDDTCDGSTDNNPDLSSLSCKTAGVCASVTKSCQSGTPICEYSKVNDYEATEASCDNKDNDCDGQTDESLTDVSQSTCLQVGVCTTDSVKASCSAGKWTCDYSAVPNYESATQTEAACDSKDNDCDGKTDEGC